MSTDASFDDLLGKDDEVGAILDIPPIYQYGRRYLGVTVTAKNYREILEKEGRAGINHHNKHLKAYLQGKKMFKDGFQKDAEGKLLRDFSGNPIPAMYEVKQELTLLTDK